jgi:hypothetical protein
MTQPLDLAGVPSGWLLDNEQTTRNPNATSCRRFVQGAKLNVDTLFKTLFSIRSTNRNFHTREARFTAMDVRG